MYSLDRPWARIITPVALLTWGLVVVGCGRGTDPDVVRSGDPEGSTLPGTDVPTLDSPGDTPARERVVFLGTSLTAGYGLTDETARFTDRIQAMVDSAGLPFEIVNAGVGGDTSAGGLRRVSWLLRAPLRVLVIELGANDGLRGLSVDAMRENLQAVVDSARTQYPSARLVLAGMEAPPNLGAAYVVDFRSVFSELAAHNDAVLIPFLLDGVAGDPTLNQVDGKHPTAEGHRVVAETVWRILGPVLHELTEGGADRP